MSHSFVRVLVHLTWSTLGRAPILDAETEAVVRGSVKAQVLRLEGELIAFGAWVDHVHVLVALPARVALMTFVRALKSASTVVVTRDPVRSGFRWQEGYAAFSVSEVEADRVAHYVSTQRERHERRETERALERFADDVASPS